MLALLCTATPSHAVTVNLGPDLAAGSVLPNNQYQSDLRVDPTDPDRQVITFKYNRNETETAAIATTDGGATWNSQVQNQSGDPDAVITAEGAINRSFIDKSTSGNRLGFRRSTDGGQTYSATTNLSSKVDHPHITADGSASSPNQGRLYIAGRRSDSGGIDLSRSDDNGQTWSTTTRNLGGQFNSGFVYNLQTTRDGTLLIPMRGKNNIRSKNGVYDGNEVRLGVVRSTDGGQSLSAPITIGTRVGPASQGPGGFFGTTLGIGAHEGGERAYFGYVENRQQPDGAVLKLATSDDAGQSWTTPRTIITPPENRGVGSSSLMVNPDGVLGVQYYLINGGDAGYSVHFAASVDGGQTFTDPVTLAQFASEPPDQPRYFGQDQVFGQAGSDGAFYTVWTDNSAGDGKYTIHSRRVFVNVPEPASLLLFLGGASLLVVRRRTVTH